MDQFLPTFVLWVAVVIYIGTAVRHLDPGDMIELAAAYFIVPVVGLYFSLRFRFVVLAWLATLAISFAVPALVYWLCEWLVRTESVENAFPHTAFITLPVQLALAFLLLWRLRVNLARRTFSLR